MRGAEAILRRSKLLNRDVVIKQRIEKKYRVRELDERLRKERTRREARLLHKAKLAGVNCPIVLQVDDFEIVMGFVDGIRPKMNKKEAKIAGKMLAKLHAADIIHGDFTPANLFVKGNDMFVIDFGLGFISKDIEDKAVDVFTMLRAISQNVKDAFTEEYGSYTKSNSILKRVKIVEKRVRYAT